MITKYSSPVEYILKASPHKILGEEVDRPEINVNHLLGKKLSLTFLNKIFCTNCWREIAKSFGGYCYPCSQKLAAADLCYVKPELCHYQKGTCREPEWGKAFCLTPTTVYLANSSGAKVGITRPNNLLNRWIDQGAIQGLPIAEVSERKVAGFFEVALKDYIADKTNWRKMLSFENPLLDLAKMRDDIFFRAQTELDDLESRFGMRAIKIMETEKSTTIEYPVSQFPQPLKSLSFDQNAATIEGQLWGIKGQYLIFEHGVFNIRKHEGYHCRWQW